METTRFREIPAASVRSPIAIAASDIVPGSGVPTTADAGVAVICAPGSASGDGTSEILPQGEFVTVRIAARDQ
ncbi:MAG TPA: hypothetical protein VGF61_11390 [Candidatus Acidoferrum sp.]